MRVTGIGGLFFRSQNPDARTARYREHLDIEAGQNGVWEQEAGMTVFAPFPSDSEYFPADQSFMLNLRMTQLDALAAMLDAGASRSSADQTGMEQNLAGSLAFTIPRDCRSSCGRHERNWRASPNR